MTQILSTTDLVLRKGDDPVSVDASEGFNFLHVGRESSATTLAMTLAGRYKPHSGTVDGPGFKKTALAGVHMIDSLDRQIPLRDLLREQIAWSQPFFKPTPRHPLEHDTVARWLEPLGLEELDSDTSVGELNVLDRFRFRILLALVSRPNAELLIVDDVDQIRDMSLRAKLLDNLYAVAEEVPVLVTSANEEDR
ncbi:hypothetical protein CKJ80_00400 [Corynebacterium hadale]|uniref:ABC transporter ATP-binding protein n=1 Tax=Corynebacterium hadale TaxID=2026255 RepID=A0AB36RMN7_9CORY|nr:hypothetical protein [Corynebacterium hadale]PAT11725.1 hypothetical protein CKJ80_00400 [Corynebacterium hadale]